MIQGLRGMFENQARAKRYNISKALFVYKLAVGSPVSSHVIKMMSYIETMDKHGCELKNDLATDVILPSLAASYEPFSMNFHMNGMKKIMAELHVMLKIAEYSIKKNPNRVMMVQKGKKKRKHWTPPEGNGKEKVSDEPSTKAKYGPSPDEE
jgi:hypothetical protein